MKVAEVRERFLEFMKKRGHVVVPGASLVPENDPTTLFTSSGMQPLVPYLLGKEHPAGKCIANSQRSFRSEDIEEVGDNRHTTYFEMLGNWSFGDYFKKEQLGWFYEFLTKEVNIPSERLSVTCFEGDQKYGLPRDEESFEIWKGLGIPEERIFFYGGKKNWWSRGGPPESTPVGDPAGPDSEVFYQFDLPHDPSFGAECYPNCDCGRYLEIGNSVFMEYKRQSPDTFLKLPRKNVDFGGGLERISAASENNPDIFMIDVFTPLLTKLEQLSGKKYDEAKRSFRIIADHTRAAEELIKDGVRPSNTEQGYVLRRLLRRAIMHGDKLGVPAGQLFEGKLEKEEEDKFRQTLARGLREFEKGERDVFKLVTSYGLPIDVVKELTNVDEAKLAKQIEEHQRLSRAGSEQKFKGGLADTSEMSVKYHTATHLLHQALREVLGPHVYQRGSNITPERLRFDFSHPFKMSDEEKKKVEDLVNEQIKRALPVTHTDISLEEAQKMGAIGAFSAKGGPAYGGEEKYGDPASVSGAGKVRVYKIGDFSLEFCGGPHVGNTRELEAGGRKFRVLKEEAVATGIRRIKAVLE